MLDEASELAELRINRRNAEAIRDWLLTQILVGGSEQETEPSDDESDQNEDEQALQHLGPARCEHAAQLIEAALQQRESVVE